MEKRLASLVLASAVMLAAWAADAAVICQKGNRVKLRPESCKPGWTQLAAFGGPGDPTGTWAFSGGTLFANSSYRRVEPRYLSLAPDGTGRLHFEGGDGGVVTCGTFTWAHAATPTLTLDLQSIGYLGTRVVQYALAGSDGLAIAGSDGRAAELARVDAIPAASDCAPLTEIALFTGLPIPEYWTGLAFDGRQLWYEVANVSEIVPVDPATGTAGAQREFGAFQQTHPHASSESDFWTHCACGTSVEAALVSSANRLIEDVHTANELGLEIGVRAIAWDPASRTLWLHGHSRENEGKLLTVDPGAEPDVLLQSSDLDGDFAALAFDGRSLWALHQSARSLVRIDPATGFATGNFKLPNAFADWRGIAVVGDELIVLGDTGLEGALLKVAIPAP
jgi:hypothetical protein